VQNTRLLFLLRGGKKIDDFTIIEFLGVYSPERTAENRTVGCGEGESLKIERDVLSSVSKFRCARRNVGALTSIGSFLLC
jgi:hypothetical protein